ncbi:MAG TPA: lactate utilization protein C [Thermoleophilaceae bacterium]|nr:lactate utilization protein C [Thermoleophilaceae bacterium]
MSAREEMLGRIREALGAAPVAPEIPRGYRIAGRVAGGTPELVELFCERVADYQATVARTDDERLQDAIVAACASRGSTRVVRAPGGDELTPAELDDVDAAITGCALAIAETGTIVLDGGPDSGRRALTLVPDHHICVVRAEQVVADLPDAIERLADAAREGRPLTFVSGPSATSDIELERVEGVHGPRKLDVLVVG